MKRISVLVCLLAAFALPAYADAGHSQVNEPGRWSLGAMLGTPTGFTAKRYLGGSDAFDINLGAAYAPGLRFGVDYLWGLAQLLSNNSALNLDFYLGAGPFVGTLQGPCGGWSWGAACNGDLYVGGRMPIGLEAVFKRVPFTVGLEIAPGLALSAGRTGFLLDSVLIGRVLL